MDEKIIKFVQKVNEIAPEISVEGLLSVWEEIEKEEEKRLSAVWKDIEKLEEEEMKKSEKSEQKKMKKSEKAEQKKMKKLEQEKMEKPVEASTCKHMYLKGKNAKTQCMIKVKGTGE